MVEMGGMSRQMLAILGVLLATFAFGFGAGAYFGGGNSTSTVAGKNTTSFSSQSSADADTPDVHANTLLSSRIRDLEKQLAAQRKDPAADLAARIDFVRKHHKDIHLQAFTGDRLTDEMADLLGLTNE